MDKSSKTQQNVVAMSDHQPHSGYAPLSLVEAYWDALRAGRGMPKRAEIDPRGIETALEYAFILERVAPGVARMRVAGTHLHDIIGMEPRGMSVTALFQQDARIMIAGLLEEVFQTPGSAEVWMNSAGDQGQPALDARMILLPLKSDLGDVSRILGCIVCKGELNNVPRRFDIQDMKLRSLGASSVSSPRPKQDKRPHEERFIQGFAEKRTPFEAPARSAKTATTEGKKSKVTYLRLVEPDTK
jgi:hypothetical protein